jgi:hypothetical protein
MRLFFYAILFSLAASVSAFSAPPSGGVSQSITVGGRVMTPASNLFMLLCQQDSAAKYTTCRKPSDSAGYQVTTGKTFSIVAVTYNVLVAAAAGGMTLLYGDTDVGIDSASAPTNAVLPAGFTVGNVVVPFLSNTTGTFHTAYNFTVPALKYPAIYAIGAGQAAVQVWGYEQ